MTINPIVARVRQVGLYDPNPEVLARFYQTVLGLQVIGMSDLNADSIRHSIFLSSCTEADHHQLAIFANPAHRHTAFHVESLADLRTLYQQVIEYGLPIRWALNHGVSLAFYVDDPAGNMIKLYWPTGIAYPQPHGHPIDLTLSEAALRQDIAILAKRLKIEEGGE